VLPMMLICFAGGINGGDVKLMGAVGAILGWQIMLSIFVYTMMAAALLAIFEILRRKVFAKTFKRIGLFVWQVLSMHKPMDPAAADSPKIPFGVAICVGAATAVTQSLLCPSSCWLPGLF
jgi:prepilin peptidase CpaA